jgi:hypothetical protein
MSGLLVHGPQLPLVFGLIGALVWLPLAPWLNAVGLRILTIVLFGVGLYAVRDPGHKIDVTLTPLVSNFAEGTSIDDKKIPSWKTSYRRHDLVITDASPSVDLVNLVAEVNMPYPVVKDWVVKSSASPVRISSERPDITVQEPGGLPHQLPLEGASVFEIDAVRVMPRERIVVRLVTDIRVSLGAVPPMPGCSATADIRLRARHHYWGSESEESCESRPLTIKDETTGEIVVGPSEKCR